jgi:hypothetical protein
MSFVTSSEKSLCACCESRKTNELYSFKHCQITVEIPLCKKCKETATFNLQMQLKPICVSINRAVTMSHIAGYDERKISQMQREQIKRSDNNAE